jgi:hypothetical protein
MCSNKWLLCSWHYALTIVLEGIKLHSRWIRWQHESDTAGSQGSTGIKTTPILHLKATDTAHTMFVYMHADSKSCHWHHYQQQQSTAHTHKHALVYELLYVTLHASEQLQMLLQSGAVDGAVTPNLAFRGIEQQCVHSCCDAVMTIRHMC